MHPDDPRSPVGLALQRHLAERVTYDVEYRTRLTSGEWRWVQSRGQALWDEAGKPLRMAGSITDIHRASPRPLSNARFTEASSSCWSPNAPTTWKPKRSGVSRSEEEQASGDAVWACCWSPEPMSWCCAAWHAGCRAFYTPISIAAGHEMLGWRPEELIGLDKHATCHHTRAGGEPYPREECPIMLANRQGKGCRVSGDVFWRKDGTAFPVEYASHGGRRWRTLRERRHLHGHHRTAAGRTGPA